VHLGVGEKKHLSFVLDARRLSLVDASGKRAVTAGKYEVVVSGAQPEVGAKGAGFTIEGSQELPK
jgi:beta-glucosidase